ncbi:hypothetical protein M0804_014326 [Polistes exclamans]|nr:hypothetical protein M0804_014327 [Polistes exclamans]KAI4475421.1 hypothetical protein M0804_014326 [Polistes exclamans]
MSEHGESDLDATEEINVDDSDSRSSSPRNYTNHEDRGMNIVVQETSECSNSPPPSQTSSRTVQNESPRSHPFSISRLLGESQRQKTKSSSEEEVDSDKERKCISHRGSSSNTLDDGRRSWGHELEEKMSEKDDDDTGSTAETQTTNSTSSIHCTTAADLLAPFRLFPTGSSLIYTGGGVIRVPAHRPPGANGTPTGAIPAQALIPPWSLQALQHSQQQAAAAGLHRASLLANLAAHPLQAHPHLKDRLAVNPLIGVNLEHHVNDLGRCGRSQGRSIIIPQISTEGRQASKQPSNQSATVLVADIGVSVGVGVGALTDRVNAELGISLLEVGSPRKGRLCSSIITPPHLVGSRTTGITEHPPGRRLESGELHN